MTTNEHYVNNKELFAAMSAYIADIKAAGPENKPPVPNYIASCILKIATRMSGKHNYLGNRHYSEEMIMDGVENCLRYIHNFDPAKSNNPFAYFSQICTNAFNRRIEKEKEQDYVKHKFTHHTLVLNGVEDSADGDEQATSSAMNNESISDFITSFESHLANKKAKRKKKTEELSAFDELAIGDDE